MMRMLAISKKEMYHIARDPFTWSLALVLPIAMVFLFGSAIEFYPKHATIAYWDHIKNEDSRAIVKLMSSSGYFQMVPVDSPNLGYEEIESGRAKAFMVIPPDFTSRMYSTKPSKLQFLIDGSDNSFAGILSAYLPQIQSRMNFEFLGRGEPQPLFRTRYLFNPELNSKWFAVPGLAVVVMSIISILLTTLTIAREWELGSMELLLSTPVTPLEIIIGKLTPYAVLGLMGTTLVYVLARTIFHVPFVGHHWILALGSMLFLCTYLAQGLLISVITKKQMIAMQFGIMSGLLPSQLLSGFIFPIENMPQFFRYFTAILPARWYMDIIRDQFLKGSSLWELKKPFAALVVIMVVFMLMAKKRFKRDLES